MTKQELLENCTMEQLADMVVNLQGKIGELRTRCHTENTFKNFDNHLWGLLHIVGREDIKCREESIESKTLADFLPTEPIKVADMLISAEGQYERNAIGKAFYGNEKGTYNLFGVSELRQIAEHLLVYCNANENKGEIMTENNHTLGIKLPDTSKNSDLHRRRKNKCDRTLSAR